MATQIRIHGVPKEGNGRIIGRITWDAINDVADRKNYLRVVRLEEKLVESCEGYAALLYEGNVEEETGIASVHRYGNLDFLKKDDVVLVDARTGFTNVLYRTESVHNGLFVTDRCNNNCIMCSQPPRDVSDEGMVEELCRIIDVIPDQPEHLTISGGEPTLLKEGLIRVLEKLKACLPDTAVTMLSNGRMYAYEDYVKKIVQVGHEKLITSIPLYANNAADHDYIVQGKGAFDQTICGLYNAARYGLSVELRVVLHKQTIPGLLDMVDFIYRNLPFVTGVMLMGMENMGYVKKNWNLLWEDPVDYAPILEKTVQQFFRECSEFCVRRVLLL